MAKPAPTPSPPKAAKSKPTGEALPPMGGNAITALFASVVFFCIASAFGFGVLTLGWEEKIKGMLPEKAEPIAVPMAAGIFHVFVLQWLGMNVNNARVRYDVKWPTMYADKDHPNAVAYNCAQRAHQHVLEQSVAAAIAVVVASVEYPCCAGAGLALFTFSKITGNVFGYASGNANRRSWGMYGYLGLLSVLGLAILATIKKFGVEPEVAANAVAETTGPYVEMIMDKIGPMYDKAVEAAKPHLDKAMAAAAPYIEQAKAKMGM